MPEQRPVVRVAAMADIHYKRDSEGKFREVFAEASDAADVLLLAGDLTDHGLAEEAEVLAHDLEMAASIPVLAVLGNHDHESGEPEVVCETLESVGVKMIDGGCVKLGDVGFAGAKGFGGGFGRWMLAPWGERETKLFVDAAVAEEMKLRSALSRLNTRHRIVLLHYAPIEATIVGEPREIFPFLGSSRLETPIDDHGVTAVFHGHAHKGQPEGETARGARVFNVSAPVLQHAFPDRPPFHLLDLRDREEDASM